MSVNQVYILTKNSIHFECLLHQFTKVKNWNTNTNGSNLLFQQNKESAYPKFVIISKVEIDSDSCLFLEK